MSKIYREKVRDVTVFRLCGDLLIGQTQDLESAVLNEWGVRTVFLDLALVNRIDARGLGVLLELREYVQARGIDFQLTNVTRKVRRVFEIACLDSVFEIVCENEVYPKDRRQECSKIDIDIDTSIPEEVAV